MSTRSDTGGNGKMRRILLIGSLTLVGALFGAASAAASPGDIQNVTINDRLNGTRNQVTVEGRVNCQHSTEFGVIVKVTQPPDIGISTPRGNQRAEGVGAYGPSFQGVQEDNPCEPTPKRYDVVVERNFGSGPFANAPMGVLVTVGTPTEEGLAGPGPIAGDLEHLGERVRFSRGG